MKHLLNASATRLAALIRTREVSSVAVVEAHIARAREVNPTINAIVCERYDEALREAREADERVKAGGDLPPLLGVPFTVKESFAFRGMPQCAGLVARRDLRAERDAPVVERLRGAGAIALGVTNTSELCMWMETSNRVYGRTNNPYSPDRIVGGSSGGEGAIVASGASPFGVGSDVGGSIRMPAFFNGVFGHKPTSGLVPNTGQFPSGEGDVSRLLSTGPIARRAEDLPLLLRLMAGPDGEDTNCRAMTLVDPASVDVSRLTVLDVEGNGTLPVSADLRRAQARAAEALGKRGATVRKASFELLRHSFDIWSSMMSEAAPVPFRVLLGNGQPVGTLGQLGRWMLRRSPHTLPALALAALEGVADLAPARRARYLRLGEQLRGELLEAIGDGVMLYPSYASVAPPHYRPMFGRFAWVYTAILNTLGLPVTQVPLGLNDEGLPLGVQVAAAPGNDHLTLAVAQELERAFGGWRWPEPGRGRGAG